MPAEQPRPRRYWDKHAPKYDAAMEFFDRRLFGESRAWVCSRASGRTLEVAIGTGLNMAFYPPDVRLTGIDFSPGMLAIARDRAAGLGRSVDLREASALELPFEDASFDTAVCTLAMCSVPDDARAVAEMIRVLRPGGLLLLADHIQASSWPVRILQRAADLVTVPLQGEHFSRASAAARAGRWP